MALVCLDVEVGFLASRVGGPTTRLVGVEDVVVRNVGCSDTKVDGLVEMHVECEVVARVKSSRCATR